MTRNYTVSAVS